MKWLKPLLAIITDPIADLSGGYRERKRIAAENAAAIAKSEADLKIARNEAEANRVRTIEQNDTDYDIIVLKNRTKTLMDELIILVFLGLYLAHFIPSLQPYMAGGWKAMGYTGAPWYFEVIIVGIVTSTLGLMRFFRAFSNVRNNRRPTT